MTRAKASHPRPALWAARACRNLPCHCKAIFSRHTCEDKYQAAIQAIIAEIRKSDPESPALFNTGNGRGN